MKIKPDKIFQCIWDGYRKILYALWAGIVVLIVLASIVLVIGAIAGEVQFQWWFVPLWVASVTIVAWCVGDEDV